MFEEIASPQEEQELLESGFHVEPLPYPPNMVQSDSLNAYLTDEQREAAWSELLNDLADEGYWPWSSSAVEPPEISENTPASNRARVALLRAREGAAKRSYIAWPAS
jgi:hypothetical protein